MGDSPDGPHVAGGRRAIPAHGGARRANVFTRILLAQFGELSWGDVPTIPVELVLLPRWFPIHLSRMSYWARTVMVPLLVLAALRVRARNARGIRIQELFATTGKAPPNALSHRKRAWALFFNGLDRVVKVAKPFWPKPQRRPSLQPP